MRDEYEFIAINSVYLPQREVLATQALPRPQYNAFGGQYEQVASSDKSGQSGMPAISVIFRVEHMTHKK